MDGLNYITKPLSGIVTQNCLAEESNVDKFYREITVWVTLPLGILLGTFIIGVIATRIGMFMQIDRDRNVGMNYRQLLNRVSIFYGIVMYIVYPSIIANLFSAIDCFDSLKEDVLEDQIISRLTAYPEIDCSDPKYISYLFGMFIPGILIYVVLIPVAALYYMCKGD